MSTPKSRKKPSPPKFKTEDEISKGKKARRDVGIPEIAAKEMDKEEQDKNAESMADFMESCALIAPEQVRPWEVVSPEAGKKNKEGRPILFETADSLREAILGYFKHAYQHPEHKAEFKDGRLRYVPLQPILSISGVCIYLGVGANFYRNKRNEMKDNAEFSAVFEWADETIRKNKVDGAALGFFKENIIAREMGLKDHVIQEVEDKRKQIDELFPKDVDPGSV